MLVLGGVSLGLGWENTLKRETVGAPGWTITFLIHRTSLGVAGGRGQYPSVLRGEIVASETMLPDGLLPFSFFSKSWGELRI